MNQYKTILLWFVGIYLPGCTSTLIQGDILYDDRTPVDDRDVSVEISTSQGTQLIQSKEVRENGGKYSVKLGDYEGEVTVVAKAIATGYLPLISEMRGQYVYKGRPHYIPLYLERPKITIKILDKTGSPINRPIRLTTFPQILADTLVRSGTIRIPADIEGDILFMAQEEETKQLKGEEKAQLRKGESLVITIYLQEQSPRPPFSPEQPTNRYAAIFGEIWYSDQTTPVNDQVVEVDIKPRPIGFDPFSVNNGSFRINAGPIDNFEYVPVLLIVHLMRDNIYLSGKVDLKPGEQQRIKLATGVGNPTFNPVFSSFQDSASITVAGGKLDISGK